MVVTFHGYLFRYVGWVDRFLFLVGGFALIYPAYWSVVGGSALLAVLAVRQIAGVRADRSTGTAA